MESHAEPPTINNPTQPIKKPIKTPIKKLIIDNIKCILDFIVFLQQTTTIVIASNVHKLFSILQNLDTVLDENQLLTISGVVEHVFLTAIADNMQSIFNHCCTHNKITFVKLLHDTSDAESNKDVWENALLHCCSNNLCEASIFEYLFSIIKLDNDIVCSSLRASLSSANITAIYLFFTCYDIAAIFANNNNCDIYESMTSFVVDIYFELGNHDDIVYELCKILILHRTTDSDNSPTHERQA